MSAAPAPVPAAPPPPTAEAKALAEQCKQDLLAALTRKKASEKQLATIEAKIYAFEGSYLEDSSSSGGNIVKGYDGYLKPSAGGGHKRKYEVTEGDRLFSQSSLTYPRSLELKAAYDSGRM